MGATATPWRPSEAATALLWWDAPVLEAVAAALGEALENWQRAWGWQHPVPVPRCAAADAEFLRGGPWLACWQGPQPVAWVETAQCSRTEVLAGLLGGCPREAEHWTPLIEACLREACVRLAAAVPAQWREAAEDTPAQALARAWSGAVGVDFGPALGFRVLLAPAAMQARATQHAAPPRASAAQPSLCRATDALAAQAVQVEARLAGCELDLASLRALRPGDVVRLRHGLQQPAVIADAGGQALFSGYMGRRGAARAVELAEAAEAGAP